MRISFFAVSGLSLREKENDKAGRVAFYYNYLVALWNKLLKIVLVNAFDQFFIVPVVGDKYQRTHLAHHTTWNVVVTAKIFRHFLWKVEVHVGDGIASGQVVDP